MIRLIVTSATYRQSSRHRPELADVDPENRRLYRQNRFRMPAEIIRDLNLALLVLAFAVIAMMGLKDRLGHRDVGPILSGWRSAAAPLLVPVFALAVLKLSAESFSPFLYFQF